VQGLRSAFYKLSVISTSAGHTHHAFCRSMGKIAQFFKAHCSVGAIAPNGFARRQNSRKKTFDALWQKFATESGIFLDAGGSP